MQKLFYNKQFLKLTFIKLVIFSLIFSTSCSSDDDDSTDYRISATVDKDWVDAKTTVINLSITSESSEPWTITNNSENTSWIQIGQETGTGNATVTLTILENTSKDNRFAKITVSNKGYERSVYFTQGSSNDSSFDINKANWIELPTLKNVDNSILIGHFLPDNQNIRNYSMLYDTIAKIAYWVAYPLHPSYIGTSGRTDDWQYDPAIKASLQPNLFSGFSATKTDRGHQIPSADRTISKAANRTTFYFTNMTPQNSTLNQGIWGTLESKIRTWSNSSDTLYVVTGAMTKTNSISTVDYTPDNSGAMVAVPKYYYKALAKKIGNTYYTIAYKMNNEAPANNSYDSYKLTVSELEKETGFTFFPKLADSDKNKIVADQWK